MDDKIIVAILGAALGFALPFFANLWDRSRRSLRIRRALIREMIEITTEIEKKLTWVGRDVSDHINEIDRSGIVERNGIYLYLGEQEYFKVHKAYWDAKYTEIAEIIPDKDFSDFYVMYRLAEKFEEKFRDMKQTFKIGHGKKDVMAIACFDDLLTIGKELRNMLTIASKRHVFPCFFTTLFSKQTSPAGTPQP